MNEDQVKSGMEIEHKQSSVLGTKYCVYAKRYRRCI